MDEKSEHDVFPGQSEVKLTPFQLDLSDQQLRLNYQASSTFATWTALSVFMVTFGVLINNTTAGGEPKIGTMLVGLGFLFLALTSYIFFRANLRVQHGYALLALLVLVILLLCVIVLLAVRIWIKF
jgi:hypothetical protein